jgi:uroporphyrinogen-III synthase
MSDGSPLPLLAGYRIGITADRRREEQARLFEHHGASVLHGPTVECRPRIDPEELLASTRRVIDDGVETVVLTTGHGTRAWLSWAESQGLLGELLPTLQQARIIARGPKAFGAAVAAGLSVSWSPPGGTTSEIVDHLCAPGSTRPRLPVAIQVDGSLGRSAVEAFATRGVAVVPIVVYEWAPPADPLPALRLIDAVCDRTIDAVTFTSAPAVTGFFALAEEAGLRQRVVDVLNGEHVTTVCVGPICRDRLRAEGVDRTVVPSRPRLGAMVHTYATRQAQLRRPFRAGGVDAVLQGRLVLFRHAGESTVVSLSERERGVLEVLVRRPGAVVSKRSLLREVWGTTESDEHLAEVTVARLRQRLGPFGSSIETVVRRGYRLGVDGS